MDIGWMNILGQMNYRGLIKIYNMDNTTNTYTGQINEYVDWVTGKDSLSEQNVTDGLPVSGGSIRALLQGKLKIPFVIYEDKVENLYRMFSSQASLNLWLEDSTTYKSLELFNFVRPSDYEITTDISSNPKYVMSNSNDQTAAILSYTWTVKNSKGAYPDSLTAVYTITDKDGNVTQFSELYSSTNTSISINLFQYLKSGNNTVSVLLKGTSTGAIAGYTFIIVLLTLQLESSFDFNAKHSFGDKLNIPYTLTRNNTTIATSIIFTIDGAQVQKIDIAANAANTIVKDTVQIINNYSDNEYHILNIWSEMEYDNNTFRSNLLYYTFETASDSTVTNYFINVANSYESGIPPLSQFGLSGTQYLPITLKWGYYTDNLQTDTSITVQWVLSQNDTTTNLNTISVNRYEQGSDLVFVPTIYTTDNSPIYLYGYYGTKLLITIPVTISKSSLTMYEASNYVLKYSAYGRTNNSTNKTEWLDSVNNLPVVFTGVNFDNNSGWYDNSIRLSGIDTYATINYLALSGNPSLGRTIEFEFISEKVNSNADIIMRIGDTSGGHIDITPISATLYDASNNDIVHTNFKSNERIKLSFIINEVNNSTDSALVYIVNNGILERASGGSGIIFTNSTGKITIGKSNSGIRLFNLRVYNRALSYTDAYNNYVYDSDSKDSIIAKNNVIVNNAIDYDLCVNTIDTFLISGDLSKILNPAYDKDQSNSDARIQRFCPSDSTKNFVIDLGQIRKHGQSTLNYPITSMKFWTGKNTSGGTPTFTCDGQTQLLLAKNRYKMKDTSIPATKFILQANYADSSGVHNGGLERLIQDTWFNALIDGEYKLRTEPQLFSTNQIVHHNNVLLNEDGTIDGKNISNKQWGDYFTTPFPYTIRTTPDSLPCVVFYQDTTGTNTKTFLGQYVFMEDKGSDFCYGERSIYAVAKDPFCLTTTHKNDDTDANKIWDNKNVLRFEVLDINSLFTSYMSNTGFTDIILDSVTNQPSQYRFEQKFEMIYPDPDDLAGDSTVGTDKFGTNSKFLRKAQPFIDWFNWLVGTYNNQTKFQAEAAQHIDLYKMAAYYIFLLRFGLVDSLERNAQIKTYDGVHFHYEPWDMDIALGNQNTGGIAFDPPINRSTTLKNDSTTYAYSGKSTTTSNWLFDALEGWDYWINSIVPKVAQALYVAGLSYDNSIDMFEENYQNKWCEVVYNASGHYKYIDARKGANSWLNWLQGARTTHRHWWLSTSMDYYDAKWSAGDFKNHYIYFAANHDAGSIDGVDIITAKPNTATYLKLSKNYDEETIATVYATKTQPAQFDISKVSVSTKTPLTIYGATFIEELDVSCIASKIDTINLAGAYSSVLGASLKVFNMGIPITQGDNVNTYTGTVSGMTVKMSPVDASGNDALGILQTLNIRGQQGLTTSTDLLYDYDRASIVNLYAMGSGLTNFYSSKSGNQFDKLELPGVTTTNGVMSASLSVLYFNNTTWNTIEFWDASIGSSNLTTFTRCNVNSNYTLNVPSSMKSMTLLGTTGNYENSKNLVLNWINTMTANNDTISDKTLIMDRINWSPTTCDTLLTYDDLSKLAQFNNGKNTANDGTLKGYIVLNTNGVKLTAEQLTQIKAWFGDTVFNKNSAGLVIDHEMDYIQINVGSSAYIQNSQVYLNEGKHASLNATKFALGDSDTGTYNWFLREPGSTESSQIYKKVYLEQGDDGIMYIYADESNYGDYDVEILCTSTSSSLNTTITLHIVGSTYPASYTFSSTNTLLRTFGTSYVFWKPSMISEFYIQASNTFTGTIKSVQFAIQDSTGTYLLNYTDYSEFKGNSSQPVSLDSFIGYIKSSTQTYGIPIASVDTEDNIHTYTLSSKVTFISGKIITSSISLVLITDKIAIVSNDASILYSVINAKYLAQYGVDKSSFYRTELMALSGTLDFTTNSNWLTITSLKTQNARSIFKYLPNITEVILDGCTALPSTNSNITYEGDTTNQLVFDQMLNMTKLSIQNCTTLTSSLNLFLNKELLILDMSGTTINAILPTGSKLTTFEQGTPTSISLLNPTQLQPTNVKVDSTTNLTSLILANIPNTKTFAMLAKILNII